MQREQADFVFPGYEEYWNSAERKGLQRYCCVYEG